ncbi:MAG: hypothetical protein ACP5NV_06725 [Candidatus Woesearchaeota archaeon]
MGRYVSKFDKANAESDKLYDSLVNSKKVVEYKQKKNKKHIDAKKEALSKIALKDGEVIDNYETGLTKLTDAYIAYGKKAGMKHISDDEDSYHHHYDFIRTMLDRYMEQNKIDKDGLLAKFKLGEHDEVLENILLSVKRDDQVKYAKRHLAKGLADGKDPSFYEALAHSYAKAKGKTAKFSKNDIENLSRRESLLESIAMDLARDEEYTVLDQKPSIPYKKAA